MRIVGMNSSHLKKCEDIERDSFLGLRKDDFEKCLRDKNYILLVACENDEILGYVVGLNIADSVEVISIAVDGLKRRLGVGRLLIKALLDESKVRGAGEAFLEVGEANLGARALYEKVGFVAISVRPKYYNNSEDAIVMKLQLL